MDETGESTLHHTLAGFNLFKWPRKPIGSKGGAPGAGGGKGQSPKQGASKGLRPGRAFRGHSRMHKKWSTE
jgi:hypothetical protein